MLILSVLVILVMLIQLVVKLLLLIKGGICDIVIVIDVGYGGEDFGVFGLGGLYEKNIILLIVCEL